MKTLHERLNEEAYGTPFDGHRREVEGKLALLEDLRANYGSAVTSLTDEAQRELASFVYHMCAHLRPNLGEGEVGEYVDHLIRVVCADFPSICGWTTTWASSAVNSPTAPTCFGGCWRWTNWRPRFRHPPTRFTRPIRAEPPRFTR